MNKFTNIIAASVVALTPFAAQAQAGGGHTATTCAALIAASATITAGGTIGVTMASGETVSWTSPGVPVGNATRFVVIKGTTTGTGASGSFEAASAGTETWENTAPGNLSFSCAAVATGDNSANTDISGHSQTNATATGVGANTEQRFGDGGNTVTRSSLFLTTTRASTRGSNPEWSGWVSLDGHNYSGGVSGSSLDFVGGVDKLVGPDTLVGVLFGYGRVNVNDGAVFSNQLSPAIGPYFARRFQGGVMDGFVTVARPRYATTNGNFTSTRFSAAFTITGNSLGSAQNMSPFLDVRAFQEAQPAFGAIAANNVQSFRASAGVRIAGINPVMGTSLFPYVKIAGDLKTQTSTASGTDSFAAARLGLGLTGDFAGGHLALDVDLGKVRSDTFDWGVKLNWDFKF